MNTHEFRFDGYSIGDRLLEGVMFHTKVDDESLEFDEIWVDDRSKPYFAQLNEAHWFGIAREEFKRMLEFVQSEMQEKGLTLDEVVSTIVEDVGVDPRDILCEY